MRQAVAQGLLLIGGKTTGHVKDGRPLVSDKAHGMTVKACHRPSLNKIGDPVADRTGKRFCEIEIRLRETGMGGYTR